MTAWTNDATVRAMQWLGERDYENYARLRDRAKAIYREYRDSDLARCVMARELRDEVAAGQAAGPTAHDQWAVEDGSLAHIITVEIAPVADDLGAVDWLQLADYELIAAGGLGYVSRDF